METPGVMAAVMRRAARRVVPDLEETVQETLLRALVLARETIGWGRPEWPPLADATYARGTVGPLERTGELRDDLYVSQTGLSGTLSTDREYIIYSEFGTAREPPRPLLLPSVKDAMREVGIQRLRFVLTRVVSGER